MENGKIGWTVLLASMACSSFLLAHSATRSEQRKAETGAHALDLSGVWVQQVTKATRPEWVDSQGNRLERLPLTAWGEERFKASRPTHGSNAVASTTSTEPIVKCLPPGVPTIYLYGFHLPVGDYSDSRPSDHVFRIRQLCTTDFYGRPKTSDSDSTWMGDSIGRWEGDTLIVDSSGFNDKTWIDSEGHPHSDALHVVERIRRMDHNHLVNEITVDYPKAYTKTLTTKRVFDFERDWNIAEFVCEDNDVFLNYQREAGAEKK